MIEIIRKGFRLDVNPTQVVTFKKSQNLNGIQARYAYSNTISMDKTANNKKLLELFDLPTSKVGSLMNGYEVDVILNRAVQLRNQTLKIQKETKDKVDTYILYSDNALVVKLKEVYVNKLVEQYKYKKTLSDFISQSIGTDSRTMFMETQPKSGLYVIEEMPVAIKIQTVIRNMFEQSGYAVYGDFFQMTDTIKDYYVAPNSGVYQIYSGADEGFVPSFDPNLDAFTFLTATMTFFNCYADVDDTYKTVVINKWTNLSNYKTNFVDYSDSYIDYQDYIFQSKLAKRNEMKYTDSGTLYDSFFPNNLSDQTKATYLSSTFGTGTLNIFDDAKLNVDGTLPVRENGEEGEISAVRIFKVDAAVTARLYINGVVSDPVTATKMKAVSMRDVYTEFHRDYIDFILTPLVVNVLLRYSAVVAANFSMTKVFFIKQLSSYWIPLEENFTTKKDRISIKAMLVKKRKVESPILNNFNSVFLNFKERAFFPISFLKSMYPMPPNKYPWDVVIFKRYDQDKNTLFINDIAVPAITLPQAFFLSDISTIKIESNKPGDTTPDLNTDSIYIEAVDTNGGISNEAFINIKHTGKATLESNFVQGSNMHYERLGFDRGNVWFFPFNYAIGNKPNLNTTIISAVQTQNGTGPDVSFNMVQLTEAYEKVTIDISSFELYLHTQSNGNGKARAHFKLCVFNGVSELQLYEVGSADNQEQTVTIPAQQVVVNNPAIGQVLKVYMSYDFDNRRGSNSGSMNVFTDVLGANVNISTIKQL